MANPLADVIPAPPEPEPPIDKPASDAMIGMMQHVNLDMGAHLAEAFDVAARDLNVNNPTALYTLALLFARLLTVAEDEEYRLRLHTIFREMVDGVFPEMVLLTERARRQAEGLRWHDA